jgi:hypothetical protein
MKTIHRLPANLQNPLYCGSRLLICKVLLKAVVSDKADAASA